MLFKEIEGWMAVFESWWWRLKDVSWWVKSDAVEVQLVVVEVVVCNGAGWSRWRYCGLTLLDLLMVLKKKLKQKKNGYRLWYWKQREAVVVVLVVVVEVVVGVVAAEVWCGDGDRLAWFIYITQRDMFRSLPFHFVSLGSSFLIAAFRSLPLFLVPSRSAAPCFSHCIVFREWVDICCSLFRVVLHFFFLVLFLTDALYCLWFKY